MLTTVHQTLWHATTWPAKSLWTHDLTLVFIFKNSLIFIRHPTLYPSQQRHFLTPPSLLGKKYIFFLRSLGWMSIHTHTSMVPKWRLLCNMWWKIKKACCSHFDELASRPSLMAPPGGPPLTELQSLVARITSRSGQYALRTDWMWLFMLPWSLLMEPRMMMQKAACIATHCNLAEIKWA